LSESISFTQITSLFWKVDHKQKTIELKFELPIRYENPDIEMISEITETILPVLMSNGFIVQDGGMNISNEEYVIPCSFEDELIIEESLFRVKEVLNSHEWYLDIIPNFVYKD